MQEIEETAAAESGTEATVVRIPQLKSDVRVSPFGDGAASGKHFLVEVGEVCFVVNAAMRDVLAALAERPQTLEELAEIHERQTQQQISTEVLADLLATRLPESLFDHTPLPKNKKPFVFSFRLLPARYLRPVTSRLGWMFAKPFVITMLCAFVLAEYVVLSRSLVAIHHRFNWHDAVYFYLALIAATFFHELGHATACKRYECEHGDIGFGLYFIYPALYTDVTKAWRLPPLKRAVIDIAGVYFQCILIAALALHVLITHSVFSLRLIWITQLTMVFTLNPIFKMDGYWLLSDLGGLTNLHRQMAETLKRVCQKILRQPVQQPWLITGRRLKVLYLYIGLVFVYCAYIGNFLYHSVRSTMADYPLHAGQTIHYIQAAHRRGMSHEAFHGLTDLIFISLGPLLLAVIVIFFLRRIYRLLPLRVIGNRLMSLRS
jgi:putative peptide zinc metalloprotease protein